MTVPAPECISPFGQECGCPAHNGVCWPRPFPGCCDALEITPETPAGQVALIEQAMRLANEILHAFSGRQFGLCPVTVRPCRDDCNGSRARIVYDYTANGGLVEPALVGGQWFNNVCSSCVSDCSCTEVCEVTLPGPVEQIVEVLIDGVVVPADEYRVDNHRRLVRQYQIGPLTGPTSMGTSALAGNNPANRWCDFSPAPDSTIGTGPLEPGGCYPSTINNPDFAWASQSMVEATYDPNSPDTTVASFFDGPIAAANAYTFPAHPAPFTPGESIVSAPNAAGSYMRVTMVSGSMIRHPFTVYGFDLQPGTVIRMERFGRVTACWPTCQDMTKPLGEPGTFGVTYRIGTPVPEFGRFAAGLLACQLIAACSPNAAECCTLPANIQSIAREGVSMDLMPVGVNVDGLAEFGRTGIPEVDLWLASVNPHKLQARSRAYSVDKRPPRSTTWPCDD